jgi:hypothetical protein
MTTLIRRAARSAALLAVLAALAACANGGVGGKRNMSPDPTADIFIGRNSGFAPQDRG